MSAVLTHKLLNILLPPLTLIVLILLLPIYYVFRFIDFIKRCIYIENMARKVVLISGASSGIGEYIAYEYASRGACFFLVARREDRLQAVAVKARELGSPDVIVIPSDVSKVEDCKRFVDQTLNHFGRLDHLVNNAGIMQRTLFEDSTEISNFYPIISTNFWGSVYATDFAIPYLKESKGKIIIVASTGGWFPTAGLCFYNASKAALKAFFDTLRVELGSDIAVTIATPGIIDSEMVSDPKSMLNKIEEMFVIPESTEVCAKAIVRGACRGQRCITVPSWFALVFVLKVLCPDFLESFCRFTSITGPRYFLSAT